MRTVFVIGAGANTEIGMPSGEELKKEVAALLDLNPRSDKSKNSLIYQAIYQSCRDENYIYDDKEVEEIVNTAINISYAMPLSISIDNYIEAQKGEKNIAFCGKLAIVSAIIEAEQNSFLFHAFDDNKIQQSIIDSWYPLIFKKISEGCNIDELVSRLNNISFIIFNYDRCFEYFMYHSLMIYYNIDHEKAMEIISNLHINHPYGTVDDLWDYNNDVSFGTGTFPTQLCILTARIKTFSESIDQEKESSNGIQYLIQRADRIIFLGFAYHEQNMNLLFNRSGELYVADGVPMSDNVICYGTGYGIHEKDRLHLEKSIKMRDKRISEINISNAKCSEFFHEFWYRLSFKQEQTKQKDN